MKQPKDPYVRRAVVWSVTWLAGVQLVILYALVFWMIRTGIQNVALQNFIGVALIALNVILAILYIFI